MERQAEIRRGPGLVCALLALGLLAPGASPGEPRADPGYDRTVAALARGIESEPANRALAEQVAARMEAVRADPDAARSELQRALARERLAPLAVPGLFWRRHPETGADLRAVERWLGLPVARVATDEVGTVEANARQVAAALRALAGQDRRALLVSASKGSADVRAALEGDPALGALAPLWIDLVGVLEGTPLTDGGAAALLGELDLPADAARSLSHAVRRAAARPERFPAATRAVHVAAFPAIRDVSARARASFALLRRLGPNDGYVLLDAARRAPGRVLVLRGTDHYLRGVPDLEHRFLALLAVLLAEPRAP